MRRIGFSTGALAKGDFRLGIELQGPDCLAVELSALREDEIDNLAIALPSLDLSSFEYISFHAPSKLEKISETNLVEKLLAIQDFVHGFVVHPDVIKQTSAWTALGQKLILENMDQRKPIGRTADELSSFFDALPDATFCLDLGHAQQVDPTQSVTVELLKRFGDRLVELHVSEVDAYSNHVAVSSIAGAAFQRMASLIPERIPAIIESVVAPNRIAAEIALVRQSLDSAFLD